MGQLKAYIQEKETDKASVTFTNTFTPDDVKAEIVVEKILDNQSSKPMGLNGFEFLLAGEDNSLTQTTGTDGNAKFVLTFGLEDVGKTFVYKLTEVDTQISGMTYSEAVYEYKFVIEKDQATGELSVNISRNGEAVDGNAKFINVYADVDEPPKTSDDAHLAAMTITMLVSAVSLVVLFASNKKRYNGHYLSN